VSNEHQYWFPAKRYGWGWGLPAAWQGWVVMLCALATIGAAMLRLLPAHPVAFQIVLLAIVGVLILICYWKGEPPRWRWGDPRR
jgi:uncharacterized membrane protein YhaH (DUF805 family)